ncbi:hypothetical protein ACFVWZ_10245 [Streptomyces sp. NPDC058200]|uniref:hypothetical protein n=1 Tax=Streptomyces sp. NPDC058200 TaxID=3346378 RepID=UPI0036EC142E
MGCLAERMTCAPVILLGHGGGLHKTAPGTVSRARRYAAEGFAIVAIDAPHHGDRAEDAARITVPVRFLVQWDDQLVPRDQSLALFDALASAEKTLHANPGKHGDVPSFEVDSSLRFFARHLS